MAARLAASDPTKAASTAVIVVPMLSPSKIGSAACKSIKSFA